MAEISLCNDSWRSPAVPQPVRSSFERKGEQGNEYSGKGRDRRARLVKNLGDLDSDEWHKLISGAVFVFSLFGYFAYFIVTRDEGKNQNDKSRASAEPK